VRQTASGHRRCSRFVRAQAESLSPIKALAFRFRLAEAKGVGVLESGSAGHVVAGPRFFFSIWTFLINIQQMNSAQFFFKKI
jgi:hypothetical protein